MSQTSLLPDPAPAELELESEQAQDARAQAADQVLPFPDPISVEPDMVGGTLPGNESKDEPDWKLRFWLVTLAAIALLTLISFAWGERHDRVKQLTHTLNWNERKLDAANKEIAQLKSQAEAKEVPVRYPTSMSSAQQKELLALYTRLNQAERRVTHFTALLNAYHRLFVEHDRPRATQALLEAIATTSNDIGSPRVEFNVGAPVVKLVEGGFTTDTYCSDNSEEPYTVFVKSR